MASICPLWPPLAREPGVVRAALIRLNPSYRNDRVLARGLRELAAPGGTYLPGFIRDTEAILVAARELFADSGDEREVALCNLALVEKVWDPESRWEYYEQACDYFESVGDVAGVACCDRALARGMASDPERRPALERARAGFAAAGLAAEEAECCRVLATSGHGALGVDPPPREVADLLLAEARRLYLDAGQREAAAHCADIRAFYALQTGDYNAFDAHLIDSLDLCPPAARQQDLPPEIAKLRHLLLDLHASAVPDSSPAKTNEHLGRLVRRFPHLAHARNLAAAHLDCADRWAWKYDCGFLEGREMHLAVAAGLYEEAGDEPGLVEVGFELALLADRLAVSVALVDPEDTSFQAGARVDDVHKVRDLVDDREQVLRDCRAYYRTHGDFSRAGDCSPQLGVWARRRGDRVTAREEFLRALDDYQADAAWPAYEPGDPSRLLDPGRAAGDLLLRSTSICQNALGELALAEGETDQARTWFKTAERNAQGLLAADIRHRLQKNLREL